MQRAAPHGSRRRRRRAQQGQDIFDLVKKVAKNHLRRSIAKKGVEYAPGIYPNITKWVKNKTLKRILNSDAAHLVLNKAVKTEDRRFCNGNATTNLEINKFFENEENQDIKNNYMGVYSIDSITRYIYFYKIIRKRNGKYPFAIFNTDKHNKPGAHWKIFMDIHPLP